MAALPTLQTSKQFWLRWCLPNLALSFLNQQQPGTVSRVPGMAALLGRGGADSVWVVGDSGAPPNLAPGANACLATPSYSTEYNTCLHVTCTTYRWLIVMCESLILNVLT